MLGKLVRGGHFELKGVDSKRRKTRDKPAIPGRSFLVLLAIRKHHHHI